MSKVVMKGVDIPIDQIRPSPYQPRLSFDLEDIKGSIIRDGILVPLTVRKKDGYYELVDGERRWRVAKELGYKAVPCDVIDIDDETARRMVWKVNTLRKDYTTKEKAYYFKTLQEKYGMSIRGIARECDLAPNIVLAHLNIFKLPESYREMVWNGKISVTHIQELEPMFTKVEEGVMDITEIIKILDQVIVQKLSVDELREKVRPRVREIEEEIRKKRLEAAEKVLKEIAPAPEIKLETPEELEKAAELLRKKAEELKTPEQILKEKMEKVENVLFSGKRNIASMIARAKELGIDTKWMEEEVEKIKNKMKFAPDDALADCKNLKKQISDLIKQAEEKRKEEEIEKKLREKIEKEVEEKTVQRMLTTPEYLEVAKSIPTPVAKPEGVEIPPEEIEAIKRRYEELKKRLDEITSLPEVRARGELFRNWYSHYAIVQSLSNAFCPKCGRDKGGKLVWSCCELDVREAWKMAGDKFEASQKKD